MRRKGYERQQGAAYEGLGLPRGWEMGREALRAYTIDHEKAKLREDAVRIEKHGDVTLATVSTPDVSLLEELNLSSLLYYARRSSEVAGGHKGKDSSDLRRIMLDYGFTAGRETPSLSVMSKIDSSYNVESTISLTRITASPLPVELCGLLNTNQGLQDYKELAAVLRDKRYGRTHEYVANELPIHLIVTELNMLANSAMTDFAEQHDIPVLYRNNQDAAWPRIQYSTERGDQETVARFTSPMRLVSCYVNQANVCAYLRYGNPLYSAQDLQQVAEQLNKPYSELREWRRARMGQAVMATTSELLGVDQGELKNIIYHACREGEIPHSLEVAIKAHLDQGTVGVKGLLPLIFKAHTIESPYDIIDIDCKIVGKLRECNNLAFSIIKSAEAKGFIKDYENTTSHKEDLDVYQAFAKMTVGKFSFFGRGRGLMSAAKRQADRSMLEQYINSRASRSLKKWESANQP